MRSPTFINWRELTEVQTKLVFDKFRFDTAITFTSTLRGSPPKRDINNVSNDLFRKSVDVYTIKNI